MTIKNRLTLAIPCLQYSLNEAALTVLFFIRFCLDWSFFLNWLGSLGSAGFALGRCFGWFFNQTLEPLHPAGRIHQVLFASIKRMAIWANFRVDFRHSWTSRKSIAAGASYLGLRVIFRMDVFFHNKNTILYSAGKCKGFDYPQVGNKHKPTKLRLMGQAERHDSFLFLQICYN